MTRQDTCYGDDSLTANEAYGELVRRSREVALLGSCGAVLGWDQETYMPPGGVAHRGEQTALLAGLAHQKRTDPRIGELLDLADDPALTADPTSVPAVNLRQLRRGYDKATKLPQSLVEQLARTTTLAQSHWAEARAKDDFPHFRPWLDQVIDLKRQEAAAYGYEASPYDPLLDEYEEGATAAQLTALFADLRDGLVDLVARIRDAPEQPDTDILHREFPVDRQRLFGQAASAAIGFDYRKGRLDVTTHPFCSGFGPGDCRLTTRYNPRFFNEAFFGTLHETGHGLYEQGLPAEHYGTPMGESVSLGVHESQSRMWENAVGRSRAFWTHFFPRARQTFPDALHDVDADAFHFAANAVAPSLIRVEADEVTYNLHVLIRFEIEQAILAGDLQGAEVPEAWNAKYGQYLGITPPDDARGCLQDVHWSFGLVGYFPTYTLGNVYMAQLFAKADADLGDLHAQFARGEFAPLLDWLRKHVHSQGQRHAPKDLIAHVTGAPPDHRPLLDSLEAKFAPLYGL